MYGEDFFLGREQSVSIVPFGIARTAACTRVFFFFTEREGDGRWRRDCYTVDKSLVLADERKTNNMMWVCRCGALEALTVCAVCAVCAVCTVCDVCDPCQVAMEAADMVLVRSDVCDVVAALHLGRKVKKKYIFCFFFTVFFVFCFGGQRERKTKGGGHQSPSLPEEVCAQWSTTEAIQRCTKPSCLSAPAPAPGPLPPSPEGTLVVNVLTTKTMQVHSKPTLLPVRPCPERCVIKSNG